MELNAAHSLCDSRVMLHTVRPVSDIPVKIQSMTVQLPQPVTGCLE